MGHYSRSFAALDIKAHGTLNPIFSPAIKSLTATYSPSHAYAISSNRYLSPKAQLLPEKWADRKYATRTEPFWWSCLAKKETVTKRRVLRSLMARRTRIAFVESLEKKGYNSDGTRLDPTDGVDVLYGTAQLMPREPALVIKAEDLRKETDLVLEGIFKMIGEKRGAMPKQGQHQGRNLDQQVFGQNQFHKKNAERERKPSTRNTSQNGGFKITRIVRWQTLK